MKKIPRKLLLLALLALAGGLGFWLLQERAQNPWQPLPKGGEVRLLAVTHGQKHQVFFDAPPWSQRIFKAVRTFSWPPLVDKGARISGMYASGNHPPSMEIHLIVRGRFGTEVELGDSYLLLPDGQSFRSFIRGGGSSLDGLVAAQAYFEVVPYHVRTLRFTTMIDGQRFEFATSNPAWRTNLPAWKTEPLPQTKKMGDVALTLRALGSESELHTMSKWFPKPEWEIQSRGAKTNDGFDIRATYEDAGGNSSYMALFSAPVWKVRATVARNSRFLFSDDEMRWIGTLQPPPLEAQVAKIFPRGSEAHGLWLAGAFGPGRYDLKGGAVMKNAPLEKPDGNGMANWDDKTETMHISLQRPAFVVAGWTEAAQVFRGEDGLVVKLTEQWSMGGSVNLMIYDLPDHPVRVGLADRAPLEFEFFVRPPAIPEPNPPPAKP